MRGRAEMRGDEAVRAVRATPAPLPLQALSSALGNRAFAALVARQAAPVPAAPVTPPATGAEDEILAFRTTAWPALTNHQPSSGLGRFDVELDAAAGKLAVVLNVGIDFKDGDLKQYPGFRPEELQWTDPAEMERIRETFVEDMSRTWSQNHLLRSTRPGWEQVRLSVAVSVIPADDPHFKVDIVKAPADAMPGDAATARPGSHQERTRKGT